CPQLWIEIWRHNPHGQRFDGINAYVRGHYEAVEGSPVRPRRTGAGRVGEDLGPVEFGMTRE
ncbi:MAG: hypothetical protein ACR2K0_08300, partial [Acidimicrobiales bacterium]